MSEARRPPPPFDLHVLTGFLGAGKTTLLNALLRDPALADTLVLINEFGSVALDHLLVERVEGDMMLLASGCLCCTVRGDLVASLEDALRARDNGRGTPFRRVIIETTGLADPAPVLHTVMSHPYLRLRFRLRSVVTLVDAVLGAETLDAQPEAVKQAAMADRLVLTKTDLAPEAQTLELKARLHALNPAAPILDAARGQADAASLLGGACFDPVLLGAEAADWLAAEAVEAEPAGHGGHAHRHDVNRHDSRIRSHALRWSRPVSPYAVGLFTELLASAHGAGVLRLKGLVAVTDDPSRPVILHGVQHVMHPPGRLESWPDDDHETRLVFVLKDIDPRLIDGLWRAAAGEPEIDRADFAANPLSPVPGGLLA